MTTCVSSRQEDKVLTRVSAKSTRETLKTPLLKEMKETYIEVFDWMESKNMINSSWEYQRWLKNTRSRLATCTVRVRPKYYYSLTQHGQVHFVVVAATATSNTLGLRGTVEDGARLALLLFADATAPTAKRVVKATA